MTGPVWTADQRSFSNGEHIEWSQSRVDGDSVTTLGTAHWHLEDSVCLFVYIWATLPSLQFISP